jgi:hypothetical protein
MLTFVLASAVFLLMLAFVVGFIVWAVHEHLAARKYRYLIRLHQLIPPAQAYIKGGPQWKVTFKEKGKAKTVTITAETEGEALKKFVADNAVGYDKVVEVVKL